MIVLDLMFDRNFGKFIDLRTHHKGQGGEREEEKRVGEGDLKIEIEP